MRPSVWIATLVLALGLAGCTAPQPQPSTSTLKPDPVIPVPVTPTESPTPSPTLTPRLPDVYAVAREYPINCRYGPGTYYSVIDSLEPYQSAQVAGKDSTGRWWYLHNPNFPGAYCWAASSAIDLEGEPEDVPVVGPPLVTVSQVEIRAEPPRITVGCSAFPQYVLIVAEITTNGPSLVDWRWEVGTGEVVEGEPLVFTEAGTQVVQKSLVIHGPNDYWAQVRILAPNEVVTRVQFVANCIP